MSSKKNVSIKEERKNKETAKTHLILGTQAALSNEYVGLTDVFIYTFIQ